MASAQIHQRVAPAADCNLQQQHVVNGSGAPPALARWKASHTSILDANACFKQAKEYDQGAMLLLHTAEPTSVLDLQTSPGRSCSSGTVSLSSQQSSLSSSDDSSFPVVPAQSSTVAQEVQHVRSCSKDESSGNSRTAFMVEDSSDHAAAAALQAHDVTEPEFSSWMDCMEDAAHDAHDMDFANVADMGFEYGMSSCFEMSEDNCFPIFVSDQDIMLSEPPALICYPLDELKFFNPSSLIFRSTATGSLMHEVSNDVALANESAITDHPQLVSCSPLTSSTTETTFCGAASEIQLHEQPVLQTPEFMHGLCMGSQLNDNGSCNPPQFSYQSLHGNSLFDGGAHETVTHCEEILAHAPATRSICLAGQARSSCYWAAAASDQGQVALGQEAAADSGGLQLVHLLLGCAEAINGSDFELARPTLCHLRAISSPYGDPMQRIAFHFAEALNDRLYNISSTCRAAADDDMKLAPCAAAAAGTPNVGHASSSSSWPSVLESELAYQSFYQVLPFEKFAHFTGNQAILEAVASNARVHVLDLDVGQGLQWPAFFQSLALRPDGAPAHLRMTAVGSNSYALQQTGRRLTEFARRLELSFEFNPVVAEKIENLIHQGLNRIQLNSEETLVVNCSQVLHRLVATSKQSSTSCAALENILHMIRNMNPKLVTLLEVDANHDNSNFMSRFVEALHYYCALFDTLEATLPRESSQRREIENTAFASQIKQIVAVEELVEEVQVVAEEGLNSSSTSSSCCRRHEEAAAAAPPPRRHMRSQNWQTHFQNAGFRVVTPSSYAIEQAHQLLDLYKLQQQQWLLHCNAMPYKLAQDAAVQEVLTLGWHDTPIIAVSSWKVAEL